MPAKRKPAETFDEYVGDAVESAMHRARLTQAQLAAAAGMPFSTFKRSIHGTRGFLVRELAVVAGVLGVPARSFTEDALRRSGGPSSLRPPSDGA